MKTLGLSKLGLNSVNFYEYLLNKLIDFGEKIEVEVIDTNKHDYDFILFDGGSDVSPELYNEDKHKTTYNDFARDGYEMKLFVDYLTKPVKYIGICRGSQFLNVMYGGTLYQNLDDYKKGHNYYHNIKLCDTVFPENSLRKNIPNLSRVNSTHHQAVKELGDNLIRIAYEPNTGITESYMSIDDKTRAVQFHPEMIYEFPFAIDVIKWLFHYC